MVNSQLVPPTDVIIGSGETVGKQLDNIGAMARNIESEQTRLRGLLRTRLEENKVPDLEVIESQLVRLFQNINHLADIVERHKDEYEEVLKLYLYDIVRQGIESGVLLQSRSPEDRAEILQRLNPETFNVYVSYIFSLKKAPYIFLMIEPEQSKQNGIVFEFESDDDQENIYGGLSDSDFQRICEYGALKYIKYFENLLQHSTPEDCGTNHNGVYALQEVYQSKKDEAERALQWLKDQPVETLKKSINYL